MTLIDLGEVRGDREPEPASRPPRAVGRPLRVALAGLLALFVLASSAPVARPASAVLGGRLGSQVVVLGGRVYVLAPEVGSGGSREVTAHATPARAGAGVRTLWRTAVASTGRLDGVQERDGVALLVDYQPDGVKTVAVDVATGERRWQQAGYPALAAGGGLLLLGDDIERGELRSVDPTSGRVRWSVPGHLGQAAFSDRDEDWAADQVALVTAAGRIELRDVVSGAVRATLAPPPGGWQGGLQVEVSGDLLLAFEQDEGEVWRVTAYGLAALDRRWAVERPSFGYAGTCGKVVCAFAYQGSELSGLDPATGGVRWTNPRWQTVVAVRGDRLLVIADDQAGGTASHLGVLDAATGREVADLGRWDLAFSRTPDGPYYGTRPDRAGGGLVVVELDLAGVAARLRDVLPDAAGDCAADGRDIVCRRQAGTYGWWRLPA
ncbi:Outer membrane protein assembly factor BamB, contains PQQ-like beta-propeller repeat [Micromonospora haikouensis]|uniref:Outer membrane protein assembly factor BamB, contains PQQ-like beta-propeller repeat n=1 Tax=Micromonospora haikouensis TaxID=686309 RepID=A0A1C4V0I1_9ACTN|nr:PQQ-binding-like beta-propeller repeat protein [Micromonospora haikouensis]SCE77540.1 Outer membrane protein assembly factor BamB, contains PQQ-like beta-propeller repeat [Micromonospora haikouensis]